MRERDIREVIAENVKRYMKLNKIKRVELEKALGVESVARILHADGKLGCSVTTLQRIAYVLEVKTIDLVEDWGEEE